MGGPPSPCGSPLCCQHGPCPGDVTYGAWGSGKHPRGLCPDRVPAAETGGGGRTDVADGADCQEGVREATGQGTAGRGSVCAAHGRGGGRLAQVCRVSRGLAPRHLPVTSAWFPGPTGGYGVTGTSCSLQQQQHRRATSGPSASKTHKLFLTQKLPAKGHEGLRVRVPSSPHSEARPAT